jgi:phosphoribosylformylglycinamidine synthase
MNSEQPQHVRIEIHLRPDLASGNETLTATCQQAGASGVTACKLHRLYFLQGDLPVEDIERIAQEMLTDTVTETYTLHLDAAASCMPNPQPPTPTTQPPDHKVDVTLLPGVTDPAAENLLRVAHMLGITMLERAATGQRYLLWGKLSEQELQQLAEEIFSNPVVQRYALDEPIAPPFVPYQQRDATVETIPLREADDATLRSISTERRLALVLSEMQAIQAYYRQEGREPTDAELETLAQTWSEHCVHKTFRAKIDFTTGDEGRSINETINGLLRTYIRGATERIAKPWVRSAFVDNAGIIAFDDQWDLAFKVETHNHPSALEPFGGANTGVGGVVRDILGVSARPIANTDVLCFGPPDMAESDVPDGVLHPRRIAEGVIHGVEDYGNKMGIPTVNGAVLYHPGYTSNPLVFCGCLGILPRDSHPTTPQTGDLIIVIGGRTGRDGLRGATFSSMEMDQTTSQIAGSAVQIGHPIHEKQVLEVVLRARDEQLYHAITDCGAGGLASAVGEMGKALGANVRLETVPLKYPGLRPWEIWLSEAQERMVLAVPPEHWPRLQQLSAGQNIEAVCIGEFTADRQLTLTYDDQPVGRLAMEFLHDGIPQRHLQAAWQSPISQHPPVSGDSDLPVGENEPPQPATLTETLLQLLAHPDIRSKEPVVRRYDHEVQGGTTVKPLVGIADHGPGDATVLIPLDVVASPVHPPQSGTVDDGPATVDKQRTPAPTIDTSPVRGVALAAGICPLYGDHDPYTMAWAAIDEALRNVVAVGADPDQVALLDNFCWGNPNLPDRLGSLVRCAKGCYDAAVTYNAPFISGKDSLNNEYVGADGRKHAIPGTLLISALGIVPDMQHTVTMDFKQPGNFIYIIGDTRSEMGGSHYVYGEWDMPHAEWQNTQPPQPVTGALERLRTVHQAITAGLVVACHDCSEGGLGVALAEMCIAGRIGAEIDLSMMPCAADCRRDDVLLFSESLTRFLVEVPPQYAQHFEQLCTTIPCTCIGHVATVQELAATGAVLSIQGMSGLPVVWARVRDMENAWRGSASILASVPQQGTENGGSEAVGKHQESASVIEDSVQGNAASEYHGSHRDKGDEGQSQPSLGDACQPQRTTHQPRVLILHADGTNRDREAALACELVGAEPEIVHINQLLAAERRLLDYHMLIVPGGFSYGDDLGAGTLWALDVRYRLGEDLAAFVASGRPLLGICNGFQTLVKAGLLPGDGPTPTPDATRLLPQQRTVTLAPNTSGHFECRWVYLHPNPHSPCLFTQGLEEPVYCPVAHGEGRLVTRDEHILHALQGDGLVALTYGDANGAPLGYPANPNGSMGNIAGLCNRAGNVLGMMPHPEDHILPWQHPRWHRGECGMLGLRLFANGVNAC